ncbi:hypothetical protein OG883_45030 [Streptomyces sp. NBC_01142]|uniref:hypothetical protein n=1 Tax=Streptomyces sp. NBC_01142 TaxID=2975865 RepID=UPI00224DADB3|nr:hypothetical protein [Streptomyces sp. NBC_01142]MCX4826666.1 hypothetical protein [Streptomyces sp. NBC_01142]MCX4826804.1 hypothetical protein [Streptomyces sp. NBC_01142]
MTLPQRLVEAGFGPERSVVEQAVAAAGWVRCGSCAYAGAPVGLAAHVRGGGCPAAEVGPAPARVPAAGEDAAAAPVEEPAAESAESAGGAGGAGGAEGAPGRRSRARSGSRGGAAGGDAGPVRAEAGVARGLLLPGTDDAVWKEVPLPLRQSLTMLAHRLVSPEQAVLREKENRGVRYALRAAGQRRLTGRHWHVLLTAPRESFGSARSERAQKVFGVLEQVVAEYVQPAVASSAGEEAAGAVPAVAETPAG